MKQQHIILPDCSKDLYSFEKIIGLQEDLLGIPDVRIDFSLTSLLSRTRCWVFCFSGETTSARPDALPEL